MGFLFTILGREWRLLLKNWISIFLDNSVWSGIFNLASWNQNRDFTFQHNHTNTQNWLFTMVKGNLKTIPIFGDGNRNKNCIRRFRNVRNTNVYSGPHSQQLGMIYIFHSLWKQEWYFSFSIKKIILNDKLGTVFFLLNEKIFPKF